MAEDPVSEPLRCSADPAQVLSRHLNGRAWHLRGVSVPTQRALELRCYADVSSVGVDPTPCGHGASPVEVSPFGVSYLAANAAISCGYCGHADRSLWWGICGWCGAEEEDFEAE